MIYVTFAALILAALAVSTFGTVGRSLMRQHARERDLLLNQIMHLTGRTWTPPPSEPTAPAPEVRSTIRNADQFPEWELAGEMNGAA